MERSFPRSSIGVLAHRAALAPSSCSLLAIANPIPRLAPVIMATLFMNIEGKVALITGSAKRIGRAIAVELGKRKARVGIHYRSSQREAEETLKMVRDAGADGALFQSELTNALAVEKMFRDIAGRFGSLDILVNNASVFSPSTADQTTPDEWDHQMNSNAKA